MTIKGVLFDFSGTLFRIETADSCLRAALAARGTSATPTDVDRWARELDRVGAVAGGTPPERVPEALAGLWATRDVDAVRHRAAYTGLARQVELPDPELHEEMYDRQMRPEAWHPYPDAGRVLGALRGRGVRVGVVSNIGWDLRPVFRAHGLDAYVDTYVLSYEHGVQKPDARLFRVACEALGLEPEDVLMVGDDRIADGGAAALGCAVHFVDHLPASQRPEGLVPILAGIA
ncbi:HAD-IA family hydrolase [Streptomyces sp. NPDC001941]|uniref:HAD family hydrolase n=1 Tax=Streptomyces sp. NPDC001941 TaxID=3154659 RepID=UPI003319495E